MIGSRNCSGIDAAAVDAKAADEEAAAADDEGFGDYQVPQ